MVSASSSQGWRPAAAAVALITGTMGVVYVLLMRSQGDDPLPWVLAVLCVAAVLALSAASPGASLGPAALSVSGMLLILIGVLGIFSIGLPLLVAGVLATVSAWRRLPAR
jgi:hypothetical protein